MFERMILCYVMNYIVFDKAKRLNKIVSDDVKIGCIKYQQQKINLFVEQMLDPGDN